MSLVVLYLICNKNVLLNHTMEWSCHQFIQCGDWRVPVTPHLGGGRQSSGQLPFIGSLRPLWGTDQGQVLWLCSPLPLEVFAQTLYFLLCLTVRVLFLPFNVVRIFSFANLLSVNPGNCCSVLTLTVSSAWASLRLKFALPASTLFLSRRHPRPHEMEDCKGF